MPKIVIWSFSTFIQLQKVQKMKGPFGDISKFWEKSLIVPKKIQRDPLGTPGFVGYVKKVKNERGDPLGTFKNLRKKSRTVPKKIQRDPLGTSGLVGFLEKVKMKGGTLCTKFPLARLGLRP